MFFLRIQLNDRMEHYLKKSILHNINYSAK